MEKNEVKSSSKNALSNTAVKAIITINVYKTRKNCVSDAAVYIAWCTVFRWFSNCQNAKFNRISLNNNKERKKKMGDTKPSTKVNSACTPQSYQKSQVRPALYRPQVAFVDLPCGYSFFPREKIRGKKSTRKKETKGNNKKEKKKGLQCLR